MANKFDEVVGVGMVVIVIHLVDAICSTNVDANVEGIQSFCKGVVILDKANPKAEVIVVLELRADTEVSATGTAVTV